MSAGPGIYRRVFLPFTATLGVTMAIAWWTAASLLAGALETRLHDQLAHATAVIAAGTFPFTADLLERVAELQNADFALVRADGNVGLSTFALDEHDALTRLVESSWAHAGTPRAEGYAIAVAPLAAGRASDYAAVVGVGSLAVVQSAARRVALLLGLFTLVAVAALAWWGHRQSTVIAGEIRALVEMARRIAGGDRTVQAPEPRVREIAELTAALNDMTARLVEYERDLLDANRLASLGEVSSRVAHEIRNPLTAIKLQLQLLGERLAGSADQDLTRRLLAEIQRLELIVSSTLSFGRPLTIEPRESDPNEVIEAVTGLLAPQFAHLRIALSTDPGEIPRIPIDVDRIKQVLFNLLTNAADALPDGGRVRVSTHRDAGRVCLRVEDSGPGMQRAVAGAEPGMFASTKPGGLGLGLVVCREIVEQHGGTIAVDTSPELGGARFTICLPAPAGDCSTLEPPHPR